MCRKWQYVKQTEHVCECEDDESEYDDEIGIISPQPCFFASCFSHISFSSANDHWSGGEVCAWETFIIKAISHRPNGWDVVERRQRRTRCNEDFFPSYFPFHFGGHVRLVLCAPRERQRENENRKLASKPNLDRHTLKRTRTQSNSSIFFILNYTKYFCCFSFDFLSNTLVCEFTRHSSTGARSEEENHGKNFEVKNHLLLFREFWNTHDRETDWPMREMFFLSSQHIFVSWRSS